MRAQSVMVLILATLCACSQDGPTPAGSHSETSATIVETAILSEAEAAAASEDWGSALTYFSGETDGVQGLLSGTATIDPGREIHPPHRHIEEEFLMVLEGSGEWTVGDRSLTATAGDMLYAAAWDLHGIRNSGDQPLRFVFWKWQSKGVPAPEKPAR